MDIKKHFGELHNPEFDYLEHLKHNINYSNEVTIMLVTDFELYNVHIFVMYIFGKDKICILCNWYKYWIY